MRIVCPWCGARDHREFTYKGDASAHRPPITATDMEAHKAYVFDRENPPGEHRELWLHSGGCRRHVIITRNVTTHEIVKTEAVGPWKKKLGNLLADEDPAQQGRIDEEATS